MASHLPYSRFSTRYLHPGRRFEAWREQLSVLYEPRLPETVDPATFQVDVAGFLLGPVSQMRCVADRQHFARDKRKADADGLDNYMIQIFQRGGCVADLGKGEVVLNTGDICVFDNTQPLASRNSDFDLLAIFVPRNLLAPLITNPDGRHLTAVCADDPLAILLRNHILSLNANAASLTHASGQALVAPTLALIAATLNGAPDSVEAGRSAVGLAIGTRIKQFIDDHLADPDLGAACIATSFGISRARLYRLFAAYDGVASYIRNRRLGTAMTILRNPRQRHRKIIDIALEIGFASESSFIRAFRRRYHHTPAESRFESPSPLSGGSTEHEAGDVAWREWIRSLQA
ncbi:helix-turn-helix domain-containing protein [Pelagibacterium lacus]|uniref:Helix-turn-helix domain-containing protein n=1 Tax=Pelagibacterium lacus TaxID=2282655 RepID=A0A369W4V4_9HYPH|nr:helix-turn-helix domain-containing protein [Pelagibacterium lacus]RDE09724.1 helix-turn-helix domain-containing protein [Pelagibacterium lacus]